MGKASRKKIIAAIPVALIIGVILLYLLRTTAADLFLTHMITRSGFSSPALDVDAISQKRLILSNISLGNNAEIKAERIVINYNPTELRKQGRLQDISIEKPIISFLYKDGKFDTSILSPLLEGEETTSLPFERLQVTGGEVGVKLDSIARNIANINLTLSKKGEKSVNLDLTAQFADGDLSINGFPDLKDFAGKYIISANSLSLPYIGQTAAELGITLPAEPYGKVDVDGELIHTPDQTSLAFRAETSAFRISSDNLSGEGIITADGQLDVYGDKIVSAFSVKFTDGLIEIFNPDITLAGIESMVAINSLTPPATLPGQEITFDRVHIGRLKLTAGKLRFQLQTDGTLLIEKLEAKHGDGRIWLKDLSLSPPYTDITLTLHLEAIELGELLDLAPGGYISGEGRMYGTIPLHITIPEDGGNVGVNIGKLELYSDPGEGYLRVNREGEVSQYLAESNPALKERTFKDLKDNMLDILIDALQEYHFKSLRVESRKVGGLQIPRANIIAHEDQSGQAVRIATLTINLSGLDSLLSQSIIVKESGVNMRVDQNLDNLLDFDQ